MRIISDLGATRAGARWYRAFGMERTAVTGPCRWRARDGPMPRAGQHARMLREPATINWAHVQQLRGMRGLQLVAYVPTVRWSQLAGGGHEQWIRLFGETGRGWPLRDIDRDEITQAPFADKLSVRRSFERGRASMKELRRSTTTANASVTIAADSSPRAHRLCLGLSQAVPPRTHNACP